jgi:hypothetical protein
MKNTIEETTRLLLQGTLTKDEADKILLSLSNVIDSFDSLTDEERLEIMGRYDKNVGCKIENCR